jgi:hypothetical protein
MNVKKWKIKRKKVHKNYKKLLTTLLKANKKNNLKFRRKLREKPLINQFCFRFRFRIENKRKKIK